MNPPNKRYTNYFLVDVKEVSKHLMDGFEPFGSPFYHHQDEKYYQPIIKTIVFSSDLPPQLTKREKECLQNLLEGLAVKEIADSLCCTQSNVERILRKLKEKFKVKQTKMLIRKATELGF